MWGFFLWILEKVGDTAFGKVVANALEERFPKLFKSKTKELVELYESRIEEKNVEIRRIEQDRRREQRQRQAEEGRLVGSLKRRSIATEKLLEQYHKPVYAILLSYASQHADVNGRIRSVSFLKDELSRFNAKYLGGTDTLIPPASVPRNLKTQEDLKHWFETEVLKGRYCKVKFMALVDIRRTAFWGTYLHYTQKEPKHHSIGEVLSMGDVFTDEQIDKLAISEIIRSGDIAWLASAVVAGQELEQILRNQKAIEAELKNPSLRILANSDIKDSLVQALAKFIQNSDSVADAIIDEAKFWNDKLKG